MAETKIIKAYCDKTGEYFMMPLQKIGSVWKAVDFINVPVHQAKALTSEVTQSSFETHTTLLACAKCKSRKIGGCTCPPKSVTCRKGMRYNFQCIYCTHLKIDYSDAEITQGLKEGDVLHLAQGQVVKIKLPDGRKLEEVFVGLGWDPASQGRSIDVDGSVIVAGAQNRSELVYFSNKVHPSGCVVHHGDNLTGSDSDTSGQDDENITVKLELVPRDRDRLYFVLNIFDCDSRHQTFGKIRNLYIRLYDPKTRRVLLEYKVDSNIKNDTALIVAKVFRDGSGWSFKALGIGSRATNVHNLESECLDY